LSWSNLPSWLTLKAPDASALKRMKSLCDGMSLHTVCEEACCPNAGRCFENNTATFMILGNVCTRNCIFCAVRHGRPGRVDPGEPERVAETAVALSLKHVVITSVTRDDLPDGGAEQFALTIKTLRQAVPGATIEVLVPDFRGSVEALSTVIKEFPTVLNHNIETVPRLYPRVRRGASYRRSIGLLKRAKEINPGIITKSGLMVGLGEVFEEVIEVMGDLRASGCDFLTVGQYLAPSENHYPVVKYITPAMFSTYRQKGEEMGFKHIASDPLVRSSFEAVKALVSYGDNPDSGEGGAFEHRKENTPIS